MCRCDRAVGWWRGGDAGGRGGSGGLALGVESSKDLHCCFLSRRRRIRRSRLLGRWRCILSCSGGPFGCSSILCGSLRRWLGRLFRRLTRRLLRCVAWRLLGRFARWLLTRLARRLLALFLRVRVRGSDVLSAGPFSSSAGAAFSSIALKISSLSAGG